MLRQAGEVVVASGCGYELVAIASRGRLPTLSRMQKRFRPLGVAVVAWLIWHFIHYEEELVDTVPGQNRAPRRA